MAKGNGVGPEGFFTNRGSSEKGRLRVNFAGQTICLSVPGNLAEGFGRQHTKDKLNFYYASRGSLAETKSHLIYGQKVGYFRQNECLLAMKLTDEIWKELNALIRSLRRTTQP